VVVAAAWLLPITALGIRLFGLSRLLKTVSRVATTRGNDRVDTCRIGTLAHATANHLPFDLSCLERSLVVTWLLRQRGYACAIVIEAPPRMREFEAHAWVDTAVGAIGERRANAKEIARWPLAASDAS
jgi:hypothetical protein